MNFSGLLHNKVLLWGGGAVLAIGGVFLLANARSNAAQTDSSGADSGGLYYPPTVIGGGSTGGDVAPGGLNSSTSYGTDNSIQQLIDGNLALANVQAGTTKYTADIDKAIALAGYQSSLDVANVNNSGALALVNANNGGLLAQLQASIAGALGLANANNSAAQRLAVENNNTAVQGGILSYFSSVGATIGSVVLGGDPTRSGTVNVTGTTGGSGSPSPSTAAASLYQTVLGRAADPSGLSYWSGRIAAAGGQVTPEIRAAFISSAQGAGETVRSA